jgi:Bacterial SH3 domain
MLPMVQLLRMSHRNTIDFPSIPLPISQDDYLRRKSATPRYGLILGLLLIVCLLVGCGPETAGSQDDLTTATHTIALNYQNHRNLTQANSELAELPVANANQWLLLITETAVTENSDPNQTNALVSLVMDLGLQSNTIYAYALQNNLVAAAPPPVVQIVQSTPEAVAAASQADAVAVLSTPTTTSQQAVVVESTSITTTTATTNTTAVTTTTTITPTATPVPLAPVTNPQVVASSALNVRSGPGTDYPIIAALQQSEIANITGKNTNGDWWEISLADGQTGWVFGSLVTTSGDVTGVAVAANIPAPPPPATTAPAEPAPTAAPAVDPNAAPHFTLVSRRLWNKAENDGCVGKHLLRVHILDANDNRINGIRLKGIYTGEELVTGDQGKGDGIIEFDLHGSGEGFMVIKNNDGRDATSDRAEGFTTRSVDIDKPTLIAAGYCTNDEDCQIFYNSWGCQGHHSWEAIFKRNY